MNDVLPVRGRERLRDLADDEVDLLRGPRALECVRIGEQNWRMSGDDELRLMIDQPVQQGKHAQLSLRRERRFRFIQEINTITLEAVF